MKPLEDEVRDALTRHARPGEVRHMPPGVVGRVRAREAVFVGIVAAVAAVAVLAGLLVVRSLPAGSGPAPGEDGFTSPLEDVPPGWPAVDIGDATQAFVPTLDAASVVGGPFVIASGTVEGAHFSFYGWTDAEHGPCLGLLGPALDDEALRGATPAVVCAGSPPAVPAETDLVLVGARGAGAPGVVANFGFVSDRVQQLGAGVQTGGPLEWSGLDVPLLDRPAAWSVGPFLFFPPPGEGGVDARGAGDTWLAHADVCEAGAAPCPPASVQDVPISAGDPPSPAAPAPGEWPEVILGGDFAPYVDHEIDENGVLDARVVGEKVVVAYGTVQGVPWSLTGYNATGFSGFDGPVPSGQIFFGSGGQYGGSWLGPSSSRLRDLEVGGTAFGPGPLNAYAGLVTSRVASVEFRSAEGEVRPIELFDGPPGVDARYFVLWPPNGISGRIVALDETRTVIDEESLCLPAQNDPDATVAC